MFCAAIWISMSPLTYWNLNSSSKILVLQCCSIVVKKWNDIPSQIGLSNYYSRKHNTSSRYVPVAISIRNKGIIMKILKYIYLYTICANVLFPSTKAIPIMFERVTTHYKALQTWIGDNATRYHNFNALPHALPYIFFQLSMVWGYLQCVTIISICYHTINVPFIWV